MSKSLRSAEIRKQARANLHRIRQERLNRRKAPAVIDEHIASEGGDQAVVMDENVSDLATAEPDCEIDMPEVGADPTRALDEIEETSDVPVESDPAEPVETSIEASDEEHSSEDLTDVEDVLGDPGATELSGDTDQSYETSTVNVEEDISAVSDEAATEDHLEDDAKPEVEASGHEYDDQACEEVGDLPQENDESAAALDAEIDAVESDISDDVSSAPVCSTFSEPVISETDLTELEGAGPGLVWMLWNASIKNMEDLAKANPESLTSALGPVGRILDTKQLIHMAKAHTEKRV